MRAISIIDNFRAVEWDLNLPQAYLFDYLYSAPTWAESIVINGATWYWVARQKPLEDLPLSSRKKSKDTIYRLFVGLAEKGVINHQKFGPKDCIQITEKGKLWKTGKFSEAADNSPIYNSLSSSNNRVNSMSENNREHGKFSEQPKNTPSGLPIEEQRIQEALRVCTKYFEEDFPAMKKALLERNRLDLTTNEFFTELENWIRHNSLNIMLMQDPARHIPKSFSLWLSRTKAFGQSGKKKASAPQTYTPKGRRSYSPPEADQIGRSKRV
jgi:hypothetical protein